MSYNPLFVYGGVGLGKTHLIHAIGNHVYAQDPSLVIRYAHAEDYVADVVRAYQQKSFDAFKRYYRTLDLLLIDDIQFFGGKGQDAGRVFFRLQFSDRSAQADHHHLRHLPEGNRRPAGSIGVALRLGAHGRDRAAGTGNAGRDPEPEGVFRAHRAARGRVVFHRQAPALERARNRRRAGKKVTAYCRFHGREITLGNHPRTR
ncbi:MAG: DnaA/Hda family protein [Rhodospirillales bacterium]